MKRAPVAIPAITTPSSFPSSRGECKIQSKFHLCLPPPLSLVHRVYLWIGCCIRVLSRWDYVFFQATSSRRSRVVVPKNYQKFHLRLIFCYKIFPRKSHPTWFIYSSEESFVSERNVDILLRRISRRRVARSVSSPRMGLCARTSGPHVPTLEQPGGLPIPLSTHIGGYHVGMYVSSYLAGHVQGVPVEHIGPRFRETN